jgi:Spy/CpxP family protein refolding chaperone
MKNSGILKFALVASLALNVTFLATAGYFTYRQKAYWTSPFGAVMKRHQFLFEQLSLTPGQLKVLKEQTVPFRAEIDRRRQEIVGKRMELVSLLRAERPDKRAIGAAISEISSMQEEMQRRITAHMLEVKASLDRENQRKFLDLIESSMAGGVQAVCPQ